MPALMFVCELEIWITELNSMLSVFCMIFELVRLNCTGLVELTPPDGWPNLKVELYVSSVEWIRHDMHCIDHPQSIIQYPDNSLSTKDDDAIH